MSSAHNGQQPGYRDPNRRLRFDSLASIVTGDHSVNESSATAMADLHLPQDIRAFRFVLVAAISVC